MLATARKIPKTSTSTISGIELKTNGTGGTRGDHYSGDGVSTRATSMQRFSTTSGGGISPPLKY